MFKLKIIWTLAVVSIVSFALQAQSNYMVGNYVEVGMSECGNFITPDAAPATFDVTDFSGRLGVVADPGRDGFDVGSPEMCGDYFMPGSPVEGFAIEYGLPSTTYTSNGTFSPDCAGSDFVADAIASSSYSGPTGTITITAMQATVPGTDISILQRSAVLANGLIMANWVQICNEDETVGAVYPHVYYVRNMDPDNDQAISGGFTTRNKVIMQRPADDAAYVIAAGTTTDCTLGLVSSEPSARVSYGGFNMGDPSDIWKGHAPYSQSGANTADEAIQIAFHKGILAAGECTCFSYAYVFRHDASRNAARITDMPCHSIPNPLDPFVTEDDYAEFARLVNEITVTPSATGLSLYPNPASNRVMMESDWSGETLQIEVYDVFGRLVYAEKTAAASGPVEVQLPDLAQGQYLVSVQDNSQRRTAHLNIAR